jgi:hypothetical protein
MSKKSNLLKHKVEKFLHYYEIFEEYGDCKAVRSHALLRDVYKLIPEIQNEIDNRLRALEYLNE